MELNVDAVVNFYGNDLRRAVRYRAGQQLIAEALEGLGLEIDYADKSLRKTGVFVTYAAV